MASNVTFSQLRSSSALADHVPDDQALRWQAAVQQIIPTPAEHWTPAVGRAAALALLGCDDTTLDLLVHAGLRCLGSGTDVRFDRYDLVNVAICAGTGRSVPEVAQRFLLTYADGAPDGWTAGRTWAIRWVLTCADPLCESGIWRIALPAPHLFGGRYKGAVTGPGSIGADQLEARGGTVHIAARVVTAGRSETVRSARARRLFDDLLADLEAERLRYHWLPTGLRSDAAAAAANGTLDCVSAALLLQARGRALGLRTRTRQGRMLGMVAVEHAWVEFQDEDGRWRPLDPILALLGRQTGADRDDARFREFCAGSVPGRFLPWDRPAGQPLVQHSCDSGGEKWFESFVATPVE